MKLITFKSKTGRPHVGLLRGEKTVLDLAEWRPSTGPMPYFDMVDMIERWDRWQPIIKEARAAPEEDLVEQGALLALDPARLMSPIPRPRKNVMCMGRNYPEHAAESLRAIGETPPTSRPQYPAIFTKSPTTVIGPYDNIPFDPSVSEQIDWEVELAVIIGRPGKNIRREDALQHIFGYTILNDVSARDIQYRHGNQFFKGKSLDGSCPMGPWLVTADEIPNPGKLELWTRVNGVEKQHDNTGSMMWDVPAIIEVMSLGMTLEPGDVIATGTPAGVGHARQPAEFLRPGDVLESYVEGIGALRNEIVRVGD